MILRFFYFIALITSVWTSAQVTILADTDKKVLQVKERFVLYVIQEVNGSDLIQETPLRTPDLSKFTIVGQGSVRQTYGDPATNTAINQLVYEFLLEPKTTGKLRIGSFLVTVNGKIYMTDPIDVLVKEGDTRREVDVVDDDKVYFDLKVDQQDLYLFQPTLAIVRAYSKDFNNLRKVGAVHVESSRQVQVRPVSLRKADIEQERETASQVLAVLIIHPKTSGKIQIPAPGVQYTDSDRKTETIKAKTPVLKVRELPAKTPKGFNNAVGNFNLALTSAALDGIVEQSKPTEIILSLKGEGDFAKIDFPKIIASDAYSIYPPKTQFIPSKGSNGLKGEYIARYLIVPKVQGQFQVLMEPFSYFNPKSAEFTVVETPKVLLTALSPEQVSSNKSAMEKVNEYTNNVLETVNTPVIETAKFQVKEESEINWNALFLNYLLIGGFLILLLYLFTSYKRHSSSNSRFKEKILSTTKGLYEMDPSLQQLVKDYLAQMRNHAVANHSTSYFDTFANLVTALNTASIAGGFEDLKEYLKVAKGPQIMEDFRSIKQQMEIEKYAPEHSSEHLLELYYQLKDLLNKIL